MSFLFKLFFKKELMDYFDVAIMLAPGIVGMILEYKDVYSDDIVNHLYEQKLPVQVCDKVLFLTVVHSVLDDTYTEEKATEQLKDAYRKFVNAL